MTGEERERRTILLGDDSGAASWHASNEHEREVDTEKLRLAEDDWDVPKPQEPWQSFGAGARYGTLLHDLLQWQAERDWPLAQGLEGPEWCALMERQPLLTDAERALLSPWLRAITVTPLPLAGASDVVLGSLKTADTTPSAIARTTTSTPSP